MNASEGTVLVGYVHNRMGANAGTAAAVVELGYVDEGKIVSSENLEGIGKKLAMHIVAARPLYLSPENVPAHEVQKERDMLSKLHADSGKPQEIIEKIVEGKLRKYYEAICLTEQEHMIEEGNPKVGKYLKEEGVFVKRFENLNIA
jgi:elongation factor Ts